MIKYDFVVRVQESSVTLVTLCYTTGFNSFESKNFSFVSASHPFLWSTESPIQRVPEALSARLKRMTPPPFSSEIKIQRSYTSTPLHVFMLWFPVTGQVILK
jgi:hypothetical protein